MGRFVVPDFSMLFLPVVFYGRHGLEADVLESYLRRSGYPVEMVLTENGNLPEVANTPSSIAVIALGSSTIGLELAQQIQLVTGGCTKVFILAGSPDLKSNDPSVEIIQRPYHLSHVIKRIQWVSKGN